LLRFIGSQRLTIPEKESEGGTATMYTSLPAAKPINGSPSGTDVDTPPSLIELTKKNHFCRFLEKEMNAVKTEAEREAVQSILMQTKIEIRTMEKKWKRSQAALHQAGRSTSKKVANAYSPHRMQ
jgi:DNA topoisomerase VI subunit B